MPPLAVWAYLTRFSRICYALLPKGHIPFDVAVDPFYSEQNMARLKKSIAQMESTGGTIGEVDVRD